MIHEPDFCQHISQVMEVFGARSLFMGENLQIILANIAASKIMTLLD